MHVQPAVTVCSWRGAYACTGARGVARDQGAPVERKVLKYRRLSCMQAWTLDESQPNCSTPSRSDRRRVPCRVRTRRCAKNTARFDCLGVHKRSAPSQPGWGTRVPWSRAQNVLFRVARPFPKPANYGATTSQLFGQQKLPCLVYFYQAAWSRVRRVVSRLASQGILSHAHLSSAAVTWNTSLQHHQ